jgi:hypothetical protein
MMTRIFLLTMLLLAVGQKSAWPDEQPKLVPGMTRDEVRKQFGEPKNFYSRKTKRHYESGPEAVAAEQIVGPLLDVYSRKTANNEYELRIEYSADMVESRLRPTIRANRAWFIADKAVAAQGILADMAEAVDLCKDSGCRLKAKVGPPRSIECLVENPTGAQGALADKVASGWKPSESGGIGFKWSPAIILTREAWNYDHTSPIQTVNWLSEKIEEAELSVTDLLQESRESKSTTFRPMIDLGIWNPGIVSENKKPIAVAASAAPQPSQPRTAAAEIISPPPTTVQPAPAPIAVPLVSQSSSQKIVCSDRFTDVPFSSSRPDRKKLACGEEVSIVSQRGLWTRVKTRDGMEGNVATRFVGQ